MATKTVTQQRLPDNPWIIRDGAPIGLAAGVIEERLKELRAWSAETGKKLPLPAPYIIGLELRGFVVDLETGEHTPPPVYWPTPAGVAAARPWPSDEEAAQ